VSIIVKSIEQVARKQQVKADDDGQATAKQAPRHKPRQDKTAPGISWTTDFATQLLGESATDPIFISQFRRLKRAVIQSAFGALAERTANIIVITSTLPNAGKTFISMNIAQALAQERDRRVLLIDTDNIKGTLSGVLELRKHAGFFDLLDDTSISVDDIIMQTEVPNLAVIPTGERYSDSAELLHSRRANEVLNRLADEDTDRLIIFDAPPLLATADASALADLAGQFLLVVEAGQTKRHELEQALQLFREDQAVGLILNKAPTSLGTLYGGYDYYHAADGD
jgi:exopolysaccharide/PEP-CTERM locus tyrosine autokinase